MIYKRAGHWHLDVTMHGVRYREALDTTDKRVAKELEKKRIAEINQGKGASKTGRAFARKPFTEAATAYLEERKPHVSERTMQFEKEVSGRCQSTSARSLYYGSKRKTSRLTRGHG